MTLIWEYEGETTDGTVLNSCILCGSVVAERNQELHELFHDQFAELLNKSDESKQ